MEEFQAVVGQWVEKEVGDGGIGATLPSHQTINNFLPNFKVGSSRACRVTARGCF